MIQSNYINLLFQNDSDDDYESNIDSIFLLNNSVDIQNNVFYYLTLENENYVHPKLPNYDITDGIINGMYCIKNNLKSKAIKVQLLASGPMVNEIIKASKILKEDWNIDATIWSVTSYSELHNNAEDVSRWNNLHPRSIEKKS